MTTRQNLTPKQAKVALVLGATGDVSGAAKTAGVTRTTVYEWLTRADFLATVRGHEAATVGAVARRLVGLGDAALDTFAALMEDETGPSSVRLRAAEAVLANLIRIRDHAELEARVVALEQDAARPQTTGWSTRPAYLDEPPTPCPSARRSAETCVGKNPPPHEEIGHRRDGRSPSISTR